MVKPGTSRIRREVFLYFIVACLWYLATTGHAHAYIDPGTGSILLQSIIAALAIGASFVAGFWTKIKSLLPGYASEAQAQDLADEKPSEPASKR
jgi:hypothetical protein